MHRIPWGIVTHRRRRIGAALLSIALLVGCRAAPPDPREQVDRATRATMGDLVAALQVALPLALDVSAFHAPENQAALEDAIDRLRRSAIALEGHGEARDAGFARLSHRLSRDAAEISARLHRGRAEEARFFLNKLVDHCVACHSRLPGPSASGLGKTLYESVDVNTLEPAERIRLEIATRQFDLAMREIETLLAQDQVHPAQLDLGGLLESYLRVAIRVRGELPRAEATLLDWRERSELPAYLDDLVDVWMLGLRDYAKMGEAGDELGLARVASQDAASRRRFPADRRSLVHDLVASSLLHRALDGGTLGNDETAEAYYLLGVAELHAANLYWMSAPESYFEASIRSAPGSPVARQAYLLLEEATVTAYTGSSGEHLPRDIGAWLRELRELAGFGS